MKKDQRHRLIKEVFTPYGYIDLDTAPSDQGNDIRTDKEFMEYLESNYIKFRVLKKSGPGGGWPEVRYFAPYGTIVRMVKDIFGGVEDDAKSGFNKL